MRLTTPRLLLREFVEEDWRAIHEYARDPEVVRLMVWGPNTEDQTRAFVKEVLATQEQSPRTKWELGMILEGRFIGAARLWLGDAGKRDADLGYVVNRAFWGKGYATEASRALLKFGFEERKLHRIWATCDAENAASARVLEKAGMRREGHLRENLLVKGRWRDTLVYAMLDREWSATAHDTGPLPPI